jgi:hypothetical protein
MDDKHDLFEGLDGTDQVPITLTGAQVRFLHTAMKVLPDLGVIVVEAKKELCAVIADQLEQSASAFLEYKDAE